MDVVAARLAASMEIAAVAEGAAARISPTTRVAVNPAFDWRLCIVSSPLATLDPYATSGNTNYWDDDPKWTRHPRASAKECSLHTFAATRPSVSLSLLDWTYHLYDTVVIGQAIGLFKTTVRVRIRAVRFGL